MGDPVSTEPTPQIEAVIDDLLLLQTRLAGDDEIVDDGRDEGEPWAGPPR